MHIDEDLITNDRLKNALDFFDDDDTPDGAYWGLVADSLGVDVCDIWDAISSDPEFFGYGS